MFMKHARRICQRTREGWWVGQFKIRLRCQVVDTERSRKEFNGRRGDIDSLQAESSRLQAMGTITHQHIKL